MNFKGNSKYITLHFTLQSSRLLYLSSLCSQHIKISVGYFFKGTQMIIKA